MKEIKTHTTGEETKQKQNIYSGLVWYGRMSQAYTRRASRRRVKAYQIQPTNFWKLHMARINNQQHSDKNNVLQDMESCTTPTPSVYVYVCVK